MTTSSMSRRSPPRFRTAVGRPLARILAVAATATMFGCATSRDGDAKAAWRSGTVVAIGTAAALGERQADDCRERRPDPTEGDRVRYALVRYFAGRYSHLRVVPVPHASAFGAGDTVRIRAHGCEDALAAPEP